MRGTKQELERLRIKSELGQKIIHYHQAKTTQKAEEQKQKLLLKQHIMEGILRRKYNLEEEAPPRQPSPKTKGDSKLYSFGLSNPHSYTDIQPPRQEEVQNNSKIKESRSYSKEEESSDAYGKNMVNKYVDESNKWAQSFNGAEQSNDEFGFAAPQPEEEGESYQQSYDSRFNNQAMGSGTGNQVHFDLVGDSKSNVFSSMLKNQSHLSNLQSMKYEESNDAIHTEQEEQEEDQKPEENQESEEEEGRTSNVLDVYTYGQLRNKSQKQVFSSSKLVESALSQKKHHNGFEDKDRQQEPNLAEIDQAASYLSKRYTDSNNDSSSNANSNPTSNNNSHKNLDLKKSNSPRQLQKPLENTSNLEHISPPHIHKIDKGDEEDVYLTQTPQSPEYAHKSYGGFIRENQADDQYLESVRRKKIVEMERKREQRSQDRKRSQESLSKLDKSSNLDNDKKNSYGLMSKKQRKPDESPREHHPLPPPPPEKKAIPSQNKSRTSSQAEHTFSSGLDKNSQRKQSPHQASSIQSSSSKGLLKTPKSSIFENSPSRPRDKSLSKLFQDPKIQPKERKQSFAKQSNKKMMMNAITNVCLPGEISRKEREKLLEVIEQDPSEYFIFLFKEYSRNVIKGIYAYESGSGSILKIHGDKAPPELHAQQVAKFYRFDSGAKEFKPLDGCKSFSYAVHAVYIK